MEHYRAHLLQPLCTASAFTSRARTLKHMAQAAGGAGGEGRWAAAEGAEAGRAAWRGRGDLAQRAGRQGAAARQPAGGGCVRPSPRSCIHP